MNKVLGFLLLTILFVVSATAQNSNRTKVSGTIKDPAGAAILGARVFLLNTRTRFERYVVSDSSGAFAFENIEAGDYQIRVLAEGFAAQTRAVSLNANAVGNLDFSLEIGESRVTVTAEVGGAEEKQNVPQPVTLIGEGEIFERTTSVISKAAKEEVGINVQSTSPTIGAIVVRGLTGKNVANYVDGVRYTNAAQRGGINTFLNLNDPSDFQSVEVLRGSNAAQYGSDSLAGTVNLLTKSPVFGADKAELHGEINPFFSSADRSFGSSILMSYGTSKFGGYANIYGRRVNTLRTADGLDSHSAITRFLGLPSSVLYDRSPNTEFTQYGGAVKLSYAPRDDQQVIFYYQRGMQDEGKRFDQFLGGDGNLLADLRNLALDFGYLRYVKQNLGFFDSGSITASYNAQREERVNQGGQGNPTGDITHQEERTTSTGFSGFVDKTFKRNSFLIGGDFYHERFKSPAFTTNFSNTTSFSSRPRIPNNARFDSGGVYIQDAFEAIPDRLRITGALRYSGASYKVRSADTPNGTNGRPLVNSDDSQKFADFSGRIGAVVRAYEGLRFAFNYSRGFRYPNMTDLGTLGLTGDGFEVDYSTAIGLGGTIGTTAGASAVSTGLPVSKQRSEYTNNFDAAVRYSNKRFDAELTGFVLNLEDTITKQALILPAGAVGKTLGDQTITTQTANGTVFVAASTAPVLVRTNFTSARIYGIELENETRITRDFRFKGNYTYIHAEDKDTGLPPNIEGGTPPPTAFLSLKYAPAGRRFWIEGYTTLADKQDRLSSLDLSDRRTGAPHSRAQIQNFFRRGACVYGLTTPGATGCGSAGGILIATGETLAQVQDRVLPVGATINGVTVVDNNTAVPLFTRLPSYALFNLRGGFNMGERSRVFIAFENIFDNFHRNPSWGIDGAGRNLTVQYRYKF
jgi:hemoglobin/transferrin/lactoferrin receptor protein